MNKKRKSAGEKFIPGSLDESSEIFVYPFTSDECTIEYLQGHGKIMFIIRGPPGTGKNSLSKMLTDQFPSANVSSADTYFENMFSTSKRGPETLRLSHEFCHGLVETACCNEAHPIIVKNTHMKKFEMQRYIDFAAKYNYTILMAVTTHKFKVTPEILAKSNTKGLNAEYFKRRLKQWEEVFPISVGWFLSPQDSAYLLSELQTALDYLLGDGKFCRTMDIFDQSGLLKHYKARKLLYCPAICRENRYGEIKEYYLSEKVQENYGKCFPITISGYLVTTTFISAVVQLDESQIELMSKPKTVQPSRDSIDSLIGQLERTELNDSLSQHCKTVDFDVSSECKESTAVQTEVEDKVVNMHKCSFMLLAEGDDEVIYPKEFFNSVFQLMRKFADVNGGIRCDDMIELDGNMKVDRLSENAWLIKPSYVITFKSIYTGLYI